MNILFTAYSVQNTNNSSSVDFHTNFIDWRHPKQHWIRNWGGGGMEAITNLQK